VGNDGQFAKLCEVIGSPGWAQDERFQRNEARVRNQATLTPLLQQRLGQNTRKHWVQALEAAGVVCGPINTIPEVFEEPQVVHRNMLRCLEHPLAGTVPQVVVPVRFKEAGLNIENPPPLLGQHTEEILRELGRGHDDVERLRASQVI